MKRQTNGLNLIVVFQLCALFFTSCSKTYYNKAKIDGCTVIEKLFSETMLYKSTATYLSQIDTINVTVWERYCKNCVMEKIDTKIVVMERTNKKLSKFSYINKKDSAQCHFIITGIDRSQDIIIITFFKTVSNHDGYFKYKISGNKLERVDFSIGQY